MMKGIMRVSGIFTALALVFGAMSFWTFGQSASGNPPTAVPERMTVWSGIYSEAQAAQGQTVFTARCARCHGNDLNGGAVGTSLIGDRFMQFWREDNVSSLFTKIRDTMPRNSGGSLSDEEYVQVTAFILQKNGFPAGPAELKPETMLSIQIEGKEGPKPLPTNSMIQVVGCMTPDGSDGWTLTQA